MITKCAYWVYVTNVANDVWKTFRLANMLPCFVFIPDPMTLNIQNVGGVTQTDNFITKMFIAILLRKWKPNLPFAFSPCNAVPHCLNVASIFCGSFVLGPFLLCVTLNVCPFAIRESWFLYFISSWWPVAVVVVVCLLPMETCVGLQCVIVVFSGHTRLLLPTYKEVIGFRKSAAGSRKSMEEAEKVQFHLCEEVILLYFHTWNTTLFKCTIY